VIGFDTVANSPGTWYGGRRVQVCHQFAKERRFHSEERLIITSNPFCQELVELISIEGRGPKIQNKIRIVSHLLRTICISVAYTVGKLDRYVFGYLLTFLFLIVLDTTIDDLYANASNNQYSKTCSHKI
jgi:hypothetical protein